jgi:hypothetical protein
MRTKAQPTYIIQTHFHTTCHTCIKSHTKLCIYIYIHMHIHIYMYIYMCVLYAYTYVYMYIYIYIYIYVICIRNSQVDSRVVQDAFEGLSGLLDCVMLGLPAWSVSASPCGTPQQEQIREQVTVRQHGFCVCFDHSFAVCLRVMTINQHYVCVCWLSISIVSGYDDYKSALCLCMMTINQHCICVWWLSISSVSVYDDYQSALCLSTCVGLCLSMRDFVSVLLSKSMYVWNVSVYMSCSWLAR